MGNGDGVIERPPAGTAAPAARVSALSSLVGVINEDFHRPPIGGGGLS